VKGKTAFAAIACAAALAVAVLLLPSDPTPPAPTGGSTMPGTSGPRQPAEPPSETPSPAAGSDRSADRPARSELLSSADADRVALEVEVVDWELRTIAGATVTLLVPKQRQAEMVDLPAPSSNRWQTDAQGRCTVSFPESARGALLLFAEKRGVGTSGRSEARPDEEIGRVRLVLFPPAHISGRVFRGVGTPAAGATVQFMSDSPLGFRTGLPGRALGRLQADEAGRFELNLAAGSRYVVWASEGEAESDRAFVYADAGSKQELALWLEGALTIEARLLDPSGATVQGGSVMTWEQDPPQPLTPGVETPGAFLRVDRSEGGRFVLSVPRPGNYSVVGFEDRFASSLAVPIDVEEGNPHPQVTLALLQPAWISGRVRREGGSPVGNTAIHAVSSRASEPYAGVTGDTGSSYLHPTMEARTGEDGSFRIPRLHPLSAYDLLLPRGPGDPAFHAVARAVPAGTEDVEVVVPGETAVTVILECDVPEHSHPHAGVTLLRETQEGVWVGEKAVEIERQGDPPRGKGRFRIEGLFPAERCLLSAWAEGHGEAVEGPWTAKAVEEEIVVRLEGPSTLEVEVTDGDGRGVPCASVFCERITECEPLATQRWLLTPASGVVRFQPLGPGPYRLAAVRCAARSEWTEVEVAGGETRVLTLSLEP
jgi:hypothetical protein